MVTVTVALPPLTKGDGLIVSDPIDSVVEEPVKFAVTVSGPVIARLPADTLQLGVQLNDEN